MNVGDERTRSVWIDCDVAPGSTKLRRDAKADIFIIGSWIAGLLAAYELAMRSQSVIVLDRGVIGRGMTARTTAHLAPICDDTLDGLISCAHL